MINLEKQYDKMFKIIECEEPTLNEKEKRYLERAVQIIKNRVIIIPKLEYIGEDEMQEYIEIFEKFKNYKDIPKKN